MWGAVRPGACLGGEVALAGELQTSAVGGPVERVAAAAETLEAARGVDAGVVTGPLEGALVDVCGATGRKVRVWFQVAAGGTALSLRGTSVHSGQRRAHSRQTSDLSSLPDFPFCPHEPHGPGIEATSLSFLEGSRVEIF